MDVRVGVIGPKDHDLFAENIAHCLPYLGVEGVLLGGSLAEGRSPAIQQRNRLIRRLESHGLRRARYLRIAQKAIDAELDLVINVEGKLHPDAVRKMRAAGIPVALWFPDATVNYRDEMFDAGYTRIYVKDGPAAKELRSLRGYPVHHLPEACNPSWHRPIGSAGYTGDIVVAGNFYPTRVALLDRLCADEVPLALYGYGFARGLRNHKSQQLPMNRPVFGQVKARTFREASAVLNNLHPGERDSVNCRLFEAAGSGAAVLCEERSPLRELFDIGSEVLAFNSYEELLGHIRTLADDPELTRRIGDAASKRAHAEHTYQHRLPTILSDCLG